MIAEVEAGRMCICYTAASVGLANACNLLAWRLDASCSPRVPLLPQRAATAATSKGNDMGNETRQRTKHIMVRVSPDEKAKITQAAGRCDMKAPAYLRELGLGYEPKSTVDIQAFEKLAQLHGDIGRVGGLLKMWLADNSKSGFGRHLNIPELVDRLIALQEEIGETAKKL